MNYPKLFLIILTLLFGACNAAQAQLPDKLTPWEAGNPWTDPGGAVTDDSDPLCNFAFPPFGILVVTGAVNVDVLGSYNVTYSVTDAVGSTATVLRRVDVKDTAPPVLKLNGDAVVTVKKGSVWEDPLVSVTDFGVCVLTKSGIVDLNTIGTYTRTYRATDPSGNTVTVQRTIRVVGQGPKIILK